MYRSSFTFVQACLLVILASISVESIGPSYELFNSNDAAASTFSIRTNLSMPSISHIPELAYSNPATCVEGVWITYREANYVGAGVSIKPNVDYYCSPGGWLWQPQSFRTAHSKDITTPTLSLFTGTSYFGEMSQFTSGVPVYNGNFSSIIITPPGLATVYTEPNYEGVGTCVTPIPGTQVHICRDVTDWGVEPGQIKSFRLGCDLNAEHTFDPCIFDLP